MRGMEVGEIRREVVFKINPYWPRASRLLQRVYSRDAIKRGEVAIVVERGRPYFYYRAPSGTLFKLGRINDFNAKLKVGNKLGATLEFVNQIISKYKAIMKEKPPTYFPELLGRNKKSRKRRR